MISASAHSSSIGLTVLGVNYHPGYHILLTVLLLLWSTMLWGFSDMMWPTFLVPSTSHCIMFSRSWYRILFLIQKLRYCSFLLLVMLMSSKYFVILFHISSLVSIHPWDCALCDTATFETPPVFWLFLLSASRFPFLTVGKRIHNIRALSPGFQWYTMVSEKRGHFD